ncbi:kinase-like domain-containing protein [Aspergillus unguis]
MEYYEPDGYHPVHIGDFFHNRYRVVHKLGHGTFSTIWLARDEALSRYVALKICTADSDPVESQILSQLSQSLSTDGRASMVPAVLDKFDIHGPNGRHVCLVTRPARVSLAGARSASWISLFQIGVARAMAAQLVTVTRYIHSQGFVHGDIHRGNILLHPRSGFDRLSTKELYQLYGEPELIPVTRYDGQPIPPNVPSHGVVPVWLGERSENITLAEASIILSDFGTAFSPALKSTFKSHTPLSIRPPEATFQPTTPLTFSSDIWTLACTIWDMVSQRPLFENFLTNEDDMTCQQIGTLGPLPAEWWEKWAGGRDHFTHDGKPKNPDTFHYMPLEHIFQQDVQKARIEAKMPPLELKERDAFLDMIRRMLSFKPEDRPSAKEVLESEWMVQWAIPEYEKMRNLREITS